MGGYRRQRRFVGSYLPSQRYVEVILSQRRFVGGYPKSEETQGMLFSQWRFVGCYSESEICGRLHQVRAGVWEVHQVKEGFV